MPLYQSITNCVFYHWLRCSELQSFTLILPKMILLILPSSFFAGFKGLTVGLPWKLGLWSFNVMKQFCLPLRNILFITFLLFSMFFPCLFIWSYLYCYSFCKMSWYHCLLAFRIVPWDFINVRSFIRIYMYLCTYLHVYICTYSCTHTHTYIYNIHIYIYWYIYIYIYIYIYTYLYIYIYMYVYI